MINKFIGLIKQGLFFMLVLSITCNMGEKAEINTSSEPGFAHLAEGEGSFRVILYDQSNQYTLKDFSFFGHTTVGGIRRETDDSVTRIELSKIKEIKILKPHFDSKRFGDKDFLLAEITASTGSVTSDLLVPKKIVICGLDEKSGLEKSWFLHKIDRIVMQGATPLVLPSIPSALSSDAKPLAATTAPVDVITKAPAEEASTLPTVNSQEKTKRTFRKAKANKWDAFYQKNQLPDDDQQESKHLPNRTISGTFISIIDAIIDFIKAIINTIFKLF